ncbi:DUF4326 domain-containing protein [Nocardioides pakistanensis]
MSTPPRVHNKYHRDAPPGAVYIGRGGPWGNRFAIGPDGDRDEVITKHRTWLLTQPDMLRRVRADLAGESLVRFCAPRPCHGDALLEIANCTDEEFAALLDAADRRAQ